MVFFRCWSLVLLMAAAAAVREESKLSVDLSTDEYMEEELDMKLVPARISKAIRRTMRLSKEAIEKAAEKEANMTAQKEAAAAKKAEAEQKSLESEQAMAAANKKRENADKEKQAKLEAMEALNAHAEKFKEGNAKLKELTAKLDELTKKKEETYEKLTKEMQAIAEKKLAVFNEVEDAKSVIMIQAENVNKLKDELASKGRGYNEAVDSADAAQEELVEAEKMEADAEEAANNAQKELEEANIGVEHANKTFILAKKEKERKVAVAKKIKDVRDSVQTFYDAMDKSSKSMEKLYEESEGKPEAKPAHENLRTNPDVKEALIAYNEMVLMFRDLRVTSKDFYTYVADSVGEIQQNAEASIQLQCDPTEELERKAKETKDLDEWHKKCGKGVWKDLEMDQQRFPHLEKNKVKEDTVVNESP